ncbi:hypothetical protein JCM1841_001024 [Sporobolomyces salmonicolor]
MAPPAAASSPRPLPPAPPKGRYRFGALLKAPNRLLHPGELIEKELDAQSRRQASQGASNKYGGVTVGKVRSFGRVHLYDVALEDVIAGRHTPPLTLRDFEDYLAFKEKSAENLYFHLWLIEYTKLYNAHTASTRPPAEVITLGTSFRTAVDTFFAPRSPLELNVASDVRRQIDAQIAAVAQPSAAAPSNEAFLPPSAFSKCHYEASESLAVSFKAFLKNQARNADRNRGFFAIFLGVFTYLLGLIPTIACTRLDASRGWRALGLPLWWFGVVVLVGGLRKTCLVIYLFGDNRQLYPWELACEAAGSVSSSHGSSSDETAGWTSSNLHHAETGQSTFSAFDDKEKLDSPSAPEPPMPPVTVTFPTSARSREPSQATTIVPMSTPTTTDGGRRTSGFSFTDLGYYPLGPKSPSESGRSSSDSSAAAATTPGGLYFAPAAMKLPASSPMLTPFTKMLNPVVARAQRDIVLAAAGYGVLAMVLTGVVCLAVPNA